MSSKKQSFIKGAVIISAGGFVSKLLGALYRIPLTNFLGGTGMGIYQMVYPLYCILLTVSASGIPTGIARLVSSGKGQGAEKRAFILYGAIGVVGTVLMFLLAEPLAGLMGEPAVAPCCRALSPAVFFVSLLSVVRGYFQGKGNMIPTAATEISEQLIKVAIGCLSAYIYRDNLVRAVTSTLFAVTASEMISALFALSYYLKNSGGKRPLYKEKRVAPSAILRYTVPLTFTAIAMPLSQLLESVAAVRILRGITENATALFGIFSGCAVTIVNLPVSVTYGLAAASVPQISPLAAEGRMKEAKKKAYKALWITLLVSLPAAAALFVLAPYAARLIFGSLGAEERELLVLLVRIMAANAVTASLVQTSSACLTALGSPLKSTATQWISSLLRVALTAVLIKFTSLSVAGAAISANCAYLVAVALNFWYIIREGDAYENHAYRSWFRRKRFND